MFFGVFSLHLALRCVCDGRGVRFFNFVTLLDETLHDGAIDTLLYLLSLLYERMCVRSDVYTHERDRKTCQIWGTDAKYGVKRSI